MTILKPESLVQKELRLSIAYDGDESWRNNVGVLTDLRGVPVRYGLANETADMNDKIKSSDVIGIHTVTITKEMVGQRIGVFAAYECKPEGWTFPKSTNKDEYKRCSAQLAFHDIVRRAGGIAGFVTSTDDRRSILDNWYRAMLQVFR